MDLSLIPLIVGNVVCSIGVIFVNKYLFTRLAFAYSATLTGFHFIATTMFSFTLVHTGVENAGELEGRRVWVLALITSYSIWAQNLSLLVNTVSIYQVAKLFVIPTTVLLQLLIFRKRVALSTLISLIVVTVGVGLTTVEEIRGSSTGVLVALNGAVSTALQQLLYNVIMNDRKLSGVQLYYHIGPLCAGLMTFGGLLMDRFMSKSQEWIYEADIPGSTWGWVLLSCCLAFPMNFSSAMLLAKGGALTFQVLGHVKTLLVFAIGVTFFDSNITPQQYMGISVAMLGVVAYTHLQSMQTAAAAATASSATAKASA